MNLKQFPKRLDSKTSCLRISVPENLDLALEGLIRKVLREQPKTDDIYSFAANYFETLLKIRDKAGVNFSSSPLCPFHNDQDAHEMIKIAGTFTKPEKLRKTHEVENQKKKDIRRPKPKQTLRETKAVKQSTPDLIRKLPMRRGSQLEVTKPEMIEEKVEIEGEFLTSDPIKELVEKELMMEGKVKKETATTEVEPKKENKQEEQKIDKEPETKPEAVEENLENSTTDLEEAKTEETKESKEDAEVLHPPSEEQNKAEAKNEQVEEEEKQPVEKEDSKSPRNEPLPTEVLEKESPITEEKEVEKADGKQEVGIENATGGQQPDTKIDKETKATDKNIDETEVETPPVGVDSSVTNTETDKNEETIKNEQNTPESVNEVQTVTEEKEKDTSTVTQTEEKTGEGEEVKEIVVESEKSVKGAENRDEKENVSQVNPETREERATEVESGKETDEKTEVEKLPEAVQVNQTKDEEKPTETKEEKKLESPQSETPETQKKEEETTQPDKTPDNKEIDKDSKNQTTAEPVAEALHVSTDKQKPQIEENIGTENQAEETNIQRKDESETQKLEDNQSEVDKPPESEELYTVVDVQNIPQEEKEEENKLDENPEELCMVVDILNIPKEDEKPEGKTENEVQEGVNSQNKDDNANVEVLEISNVPENENKEEETKPEDFQNVENTPEAEKKEETEEKSTVEDVKNEPKKDKPDEKPVENEKKDDETNQEELCTVVDVKNIPEDERREEAGGDKQEENPEELCTVVDIDNIPKVDEIKEEKTENEVQKGETSQNNNDNNSSEVIDAGSVAGNEVKEVETKVEELQTEIVDRNLPKEVNEDNKTEVDENEKQREEITQNEEKETISEEQPKVEETQEEKNTEVEVLTVEDDKNKQEEDTNCENKIDGKPEQPPDIIEPKNPEVVQPPEEFQIKTIQTHYYDTLQVPETVTKEYIVHNVTTNTLMSLTNTVRQAIDENMNTQESLPADKQQEMETTTQISDSDDLLDIMTPTSGYSLNLSEISWQTVNGLFLDSERRYSSLEKEEIRYTTPEQNLPQVEEVIQKTIVPTGVDAVPVPPRDVEEITEEETNVKEKKPEGESDGSSESRSGDSDVPFISVEVKTVIETQIIDDEEEERENGRQPSVEVTVQATIDIQDDIGIPQSDSIEEENKISNEKGDLKPSLEQPQSTSQDIQRKESSSTEKTTGKEGSSGESDTTVSSAPTEIKRTDPSKRNFSSTRSLLSTQSLDLGKRNPLLKTRSLSTFRHGVTDFEVWNTIEKELEEAATKIQSKFRGYKTRKKLQRENAVQITTEESSPSTTPAEVEGKEEEGQQSTGEFHDSIVLAEHPR